MGSGVKMSLFYLWLYKVMDKMGTFLFRKDFKFIFEPELYLLLSDARLLQVPIG
jgi:hypothetical protein